MSIHIERDASVIVWWVTTENSSHERASAFQCPSVRRRPHVHPLLQGVSVSQARNRQKLSATNHTALRLRRPRREPQTEQDETLRFELPVEHQQFFAAHCTYRPIYRRMVRGWSVDNESESIWKKAVVTYSRYYPGNILGGLRKIMKTSVRIDSVPAKIRMENIPHTSLHRYRFCTLLEGQH